MAATIVLASIAISDGRFVFTGVMVFAVAGVQCLWLIADVRRTNLELARFIEAARAGDFSSNFERRSQGTGFDELGRSLSDLMESFRSKRADGEMERRYLRAILDQVPVPLISVADDGHVDRLNNASRRLFGTLNPTRLEQLNQLGEGFESVIRTLEPGQRQVVPIAGGDRVVVSVSRIGFAGSALRLFSLQSMRHELDGAELEAWQQLVRVLTHELMNSLTPIRSLAQTARDLLAESEDGREDAVEALGTVAKRADGLLSFVDSYRKFSRMPKPTKETVSVKQLLTRVERLFAGGDDGHQISVSVEPINLEINADPSQLEQVLINLVRNAIDAAEGAARVEMSGAVGADGRAVLTVCDYGPGMSEETVARAFVPFFTTKRGGSGVGLSLTRQIMRAHGGFVTLESKPGEGAVFRLGL
ncbi:MAG: ATP-binding protein [Myxococcota bacterium]